MDSFHIQAAAEGIRIPGREADVTAEKVCLEIWAVLEAFQAQGEDMEDIPRTILRMAAIPREGAISKATPREDILREIPGDP